MIKPIKLALLIDDEEIDQRQYKRVLKRSDLVEDVLAFTYADEAFEYLKCHRELNVDVIFLDINIPRMNGFEFLEVATAEFGDTFAKVVVAMLTTSLNPDDRARAESFAVVREFINKPLTVEDVANISTLI